MRSRLPVILWVGSLLLAAAVLSGGFFLSRQTEVVRIERDRVGITAFARQAQRELDNLESRYREHLRQLCASDLNDRFALRQEMDRLVGVRQLSSIRDTGSTEFHLIADAREADESVLPFPVFVDSGDLPLGRDNPVEFVGRDSLKEGRTGESGWAEPASGRYLFFFSHVLKRRTVMALIDREAVAESITGWLDDWLLDQMPVIWETGGTDALEGPAGFLAKNGAVTKAEPDVILPLVSPFGEWRVVSWDPRRTVVHYRLEILAVSVLLAFVVGSVGAGTAWRLRQVLSRAEKQVSFVNRVSHELRTPLTNMLLNADLAEDGASPAGVRRLALVRAEGERLARLIENVLTFSRKEKDESKLEFDSLELKPLAESLIESFAIALERKGIVASICGGNPVASGDRDAVCQILGNLISNVEKYAADGGVLEIHLACEKGVAVVQVRDRGRGIPSADSERVFLPFVRLSDRTSEGCSGTGLGLAIARDLAERMGGSINLRNGNSGGAVFELRLPVAESGNKVIDFPNRKVS